MSATSIYRQESGQVTTIAPETVRPDIADASELPENPSAATLRDAIEILKRFDAFDYELLTPGELAYAQENFLVLVDAIATREGVEPGVLGYFLTNIAESELVEIVLTDIEAEGLLEGEDDGEEA
jgi:hypothetical protein